MAIIDDLAIRILEVLEFHGGDMIPDAGYGTLLLQVAQEAHGVLAADLPNSAVTMGSPEYHRTTMAVRYLEQIGLVTVQRAHRDESAKANVVERITVVEP